MEQDESAARQPGALPPHTPLPAYYADETEHEQFLGRIFDATAPDYERIERVLAFGTGAAYRRAALQRAGLAEGAQVLDVGIGTGLVAREALRLVGPCGRVVGVDPSAGMMNQVVLPGVELLRGRAEALPRPDASSDFVSLGYALRKGYMRAVVPTIARLITRRRDTAELWRYYWDTIEACMPPESVLAALRAAGFTQIARHVELGIFSEYTAVKPG
jgi:demethylmenaquinone methyltransferase / 2-methoxy-6-polyprenyl-1,4-benzoquinol methylase